MFVQFVANRIFGFNPVCEQVIPCIPIGEVVLEEAGSHVYGQIELFEELTSQRLLGSLSPPVFTSRELPKASYRPAAFSLGNEIVSCLKQDSCCGNSFMVDR